MYIFVSAIKYIFVLNETRSKILEKNYRSIHLNGFQGTRTDKVISELGITKGAFYHYFPDKSALGYAVIDELVAPEYISLWKMLDTYTGNPMDGITQQLEVLIKQADNDSIKMGCPLNNLIQEMASLDEGFRKRLMYIVETMQEHISNALERGKATNQVSQTVDSRATAYYILATMEGSYGIAKSLQSKSVFEQAIRLLIEYLHALKV
jgi:TetR/AcrR family transcriptional regulator, transcriptional repressor for nem operon